MTGYLIRRLLQMMIVVFLSGSGDVCAAQPGARRAAGGLRQVQQSATFPITEEDIARIRAYFELDLYLPIRFSRWLIGQPNGPIIIGNNEFFPNVVVGCRKPIEETVRERRRRI